MARPALRLLAAGGLTVPGTAEIVVVGGGLAGSSAALRLARGGRRVLLLEATRGPHHKVCGEFLSMEALHYLCALRIDALALGAVPIDRVRLASGRRVSEAPLPFQAMSLTRRCLDQVLLQAAGAAGVEVRRGVHVTGVEPTGRGWSVAVRDGQAVPCAAVFLATGKHDLRTLPRPVGTHSGLVGMKMYFRLQPQQMAELAGAVELILFPGGYAGLQRVEDGSANLALLVEARTLRRLGGSWDGLLAHMAGNAPHLSRRLHGAEPLLSAPLAVATLPYGHVQHATEPGLWRLGDQAAVIPSFSGDGMSIALHSAALAADGYLHGGSAPAFQQQLALQLRGRLRLATGLSRLLVHYPVAACLAHGFPSALASAASITRIPSRHLLHEREATG